MCENRRGTLARLAHVAGIRVGCGRCGRRASRGNGGLVQGDESPMRDRVVDAVESRSG